MTACLLHAGVSYREGLYSHSGPADLQKLGQNLSLELVRKFSFKTQEVALVFFLRINHYVLLPLS